MTDRQTISDPLFQHVQDGVLDRLPRNKRVRRNLPDEGRLRMDRQLPFLCVYRTPPDRADAGTRDFVTTEAAYLVASGNQKYAEDVAALCDTIGQLMIEHFGVFLFVEIWSGPAGKASLYPVRPTFQIVTTQSQDFPSTLQAFQSALEGIEIGTTPAHVTIVTTEEIVPPDLTPLITAPDRPAYVHLGLEIAPIYRDSESGGVYPLLVHQIRSQLAQALRQAVSAFVGARKKSKPANPHSYGPTSMVQAARTVDQKLSEVSESFDFLFQVTPVNSDPSWQAFCETDYQVPPTLYYRPLPYHPNVLKRRLFEVAVERVEDPILAHLFWEKQTELDRQLSALRDLDTPRFYPSSLQLYGDVEPELLDLARQMLAACSGQSFEDDDDDSECPPAPVPESRIDAGRFLESAREEIDYYHARSPAFLGRAELNEGITAGIMVSRERLMISPELQIRESRLKPLLHHEVGTHLLTYFNGRNQPFRQLATGLAGYDGLQEGLAVLSEYLTGGLTRARLKTLAGRVVAVWTITEGAEFLDTFRLLHHEYGFSARGAFTTTLRVHRGGGLTKDAVYLRGFVRLLDYLSKGHDLEPLFIGKIALAHVPFVQELRRRGIIQPPLVLPRYYEQDDVRNRLEECRSLTVLDLLESAS